MANMDVILASFVDPCKCYVPMFGSDVKLQIAIAGRYLNDRGIVIRSIDQKRFNERRGGRQHQQQTISKYPEGNGNKH
jgi:hypothetical protein